MARVGNNRRKEDEAEDKKNNKSKEQVTMAVLKTATDSLIPWLNFTAEVSEEIGRTVPCLDAQPWVGVPETQQQWFNSYRKDMETPGEQ